MTKPPATSSLVDCDDSDTMSLDGMPHSLSLHERRSQLPMYLQGVWCLSNEDELHFVWDGYVEMQQNKKKDTHGMRVSARLARGLKSRTSKFYQSFGFDSGYPGLCLFFFYGYLFGILGKQQISMRSRSHEE
jgi:hypothetical protein